MGTMNWEGVGEAGFVGSALFEIDLLMGHERGFRGAGRPLYGRRDARRYGARFMESPLFKNDLLTAHEPGREAGSGRP